VYAFETGGAGAAGVVATILLVPSAIVAPFAAYSGDRFRRDRVLQVDYLVQGIAIGVTSVTLFVDAPSWVAYAAATVMSITITFSRPAHNALLLRSRARRKTSRRRTWSPASSRGPGRCWGR
jgi:MFS family permease